MVPAFVRHRTKLPASQASGKSGYNRCPTRDGKQKLTVMNKIHRTQARAGIEIYDNILGEDAAHG
jgi:hypothetical protein